MSKLGQVSRIQTKDKIPVPKYRPGRRALAAEEVGGIEIINIGVTYNLEDGRQVIIPWAGVTCIELEQSKPKPGGKKTAG